MAKKGISPAALSRISGINPARISEILSGRTKRPGPKSVAKIAKALDIDLNWLVTGEGSPEPAKEAPLDPVDSIIYGLRDRIRRNLPHHKQLQFIGKVEEELEEYIATEKRKQEK